MSVFVAMIVLMAVCTHTAFAQEMGDFQCRITEATDWGAIVDCEPGYATNHDRILIYGEEAADWGSLGEAVVSLPDVVEGAVVFDAGADETPNVIIVFSKRDDGALVADIYDDRSGDGKVSATVTSDGEITVTEAGPVVQVISLDGWWQRDGLVSFNLDISVDGLIRSSFGASFQEYLVTDGAPEVYAHVRDADKDGRPDYEWRQLYLPFGESSGYIRTEVVVNTEGDEPPIRGALLWPYLGDTYYDWSQYTKLSYYYSTPPIDVDWTASRVTHVAEFVGSRTQAGNYFIYSLCRLTEGEVSIACFESPFAFYDLSDGADPFPTLMIRDAYSNPGVRFMLQGTVEHPINDISYVWRYPSSKTEYAPIWDFKVNLVGTHEHTSVIEVGDLAIVTGDYATFPYWVTENAWDLTTFVADEGERVPNSEGIGAWGATLEHLAPQSYRYMAGLIDELPLDYFTTIPQGYRGEVAPHFGQHPKVYISSLDGKLHLLHATTGIWNIDGERELHYANLNEDAYLDQWQYLERGQLRRQINHTDEYLVFSGDGLVLLKKVSVLPSFVEMSPPRNHQEWSSMREQLDRRQLALSPGDLAAMAAQYDGPEWKAEGAQVRDFRPESNGFRFVLGLSHGFQFNGTAGPDLEGLAPGDYAVTYQDGFSIQPLTPAQVEVIPGSLELGLSTPVALEPVSIGIQLHNSGLTDLAGLEVQVYAGLAGSKPELVAEKVVRLLAGETASLSIPWAPARPGDWRLSFVWDEDGEALLAPENSRAEVGLQVRAPSVAGVGEIWRLSSVQEPLALLAVLVCLGLSASALAMVFARSPVGDR